MIVRFPLVPVSLGTLARAVAGLAAPVVQVLKALARAHRNRRQARVLAGLDRHMLADIGVTRADISDAFSQPFWEDPTALLNRRAEERRHHRLRSIGGSPHADDRRKNQVRTGYWI